MSIRAKLVNLFLKRTIRRQFESFESPEDFRAGGSMPFKLPQEVMTETVEVDGVAAEWVSVPGASDEHVTGTHLVEVFGAVQHPRRRRDLPTGGLAFQNITCLGVFGLCDEHI